MLYNVILSFEAALIVDIFPAGTSTDLILTVMTHRGSVDGKHRLQSMHKGAVLLHEIHRSNKAVLALLRTDAHLIILVVIGYGLGFLTQDILLDQTALQGFALLRDIVSTVAHPDFFLRECELDWHMPNVNSQLPSAVHQLVESYLVVGYLPSWLTILDAFLYQSLPVCLVDFFMEVERSKMDGDVLY